jgi:hypothetical protein
MTIHADSLQNGQNFMDITQTQELSAPTHNTPRMRRILPLFGIILLQSCYI